MLLRRAARLALVFVGLLVGCSGGGTTSTSGSGGGGGADACPNDLPASCPASAPTWSGEVAAIVAERCATCHGPGGVQAGKPFATYAQVHAQRSAVLDQVYACKMPQPGAAPLAIAQRAALLAWLVCGSLDN